MSHPRNEAPPQFVGCPSGKVPYGRRAEASQAARHIRARGGPPSEPYACSCGRFHLRSSTDHKFAKARRRR